MFLVSHNNSPVRSPGGRPLLPEDRDSLVPAGAATPDGADELDQQSQISDARVAVRRPAHLLGSRHHVLLHAARSAAHLYCPRFLLLAPAAAVLWHRYLRLRGHRRC